MKRDVAIVGAGYVGVPLAYAFAEVGKNVVLVDIDSERVARLNRGESYIEDIPSGDAASRTSRPDGSRRRPTTTSSGTPTRS